MTPPDRGQPATISIRHRTCRSSSMRTHPSECSRRVEPVRQPHGRRSSGAADARGRGESAQSAQPAAPTPAAACGRPGGERIWLSWLCRCLLLHPSACPSIRVRVIRSHARRLCERIRAAQRAQIQWRGEARRGAALVE
jgi:hypothetical protein